MSYRAVVFDLWFTLVRPDAYPAGTGRMGWLAELIGLDAGILSERWARFEPALEAGEAPGGGAGADSPELTWICGVAEELGVHVTGDVRARIAADWDLAQRAPLLRPPAETMETLAALRARGLQLGLLSNTHGLEMRAWERSPLAGMFDAVCFSHEIRVMKPAPESYQAVLRRLGVGAAEAAFVGDGGSDELLGARGHGFGLVVFARGATPSTPSRWWREHVPSLTAQADVTISSLGELVGLVGAS